MIAIVDTYHGSLQRISAKVKETLLAAGIGEISRSH
jgi:hypothetical protein